jgi:pimeloyl-ACP methyl ester carboxylesterase
MDGVPTLTLRFRPRRVPALNGFRVLATDLLGFGNSAKTLNVEYGPRLLARQSWELLDERRIDRVVIVGNSMGSTDRPHHGCGAARADPRTGAAEHARSVGRDGGEPEARDELADGPVVAEPDGVGAGRA